MDILLSGAEGTAAKAVTHRASELHCGSGGSDIAVFDNLHVLLTRTQLQALRSGAQEG